MITVIGSINMDIVTETTLFPKQGETVLGTKFHTVPGGKGANQAVSAARLGHDVQMVGCLGEDAFGSSLRANLENEKIGTTYVKSINSHATGIANIILYEADNRIIVVPGANDTVDNSFIDEAETIIRQSAIVMLQLEIPQSTVEYAIQKCNEWGIPVLLNPAPAERFKKEWMPNISFFTPNETECEDIFQMNMEAALEQYPNKLIVTLGSNGARFYDGQMHRHIAPFKSKVVDTTGAGDTFNGAFAYCIAEGKSIKEAVIFANAAASISVEKLGAQGGMPKLTEVLEKSEKTK